MDVTTRNLLRLLRAGVFGKQEQLEPLSASKWNRLYQLSVMHGITALVSDGLQVCSGQFFLQMPQSQLDRWQQSVKAVEQQGQRLNLQLSELSRLFADQHWRHLLFKGQALATYYPQPLHRTSGDIDLYFPNETLAEAADDWAESNGTDQEETSAGNLKYYWRGVTVEHHHQMGHFSFVPLNRALRHIIKQELDSSAPAYVVVNGMRIETVQPSLSLLLILVRITHYLLTDGIALKQLADLAVLLNSRKALPESERINGWLEKLRLTNLARLIGELVAQTMDVEREVIPFLSDESAPSIDRVVDELSDLRGQWRSASDQALFAPNDNSPALFRRSRHMARYFSYHPAETLTSFLASLVHIEE